MAYSSHAYIQFHGQTFLVEIDGDVLHLVVQNEDGSFKRLGPSATIEKAEDLDPKVFGSNPHYQGVMHTGRRFYVWDGGPAYTDQKKEYKVLVSYMIDRLLDLVIDLFPKKKGQTIQYAEPAQKEVDSDRLKAIRAHLEMTQPEFGDFLGGSSKNAVRDWESGARKIPSTVVEILRLKGQL